MEDFPALGATSTRAGDPSAQIPSQPGPLRQNHSIMLGGAVTSTVVNAFGATTSTGPSLSPKSQTGIMGNIQLVPGVSGMQHQQQQIHQSIGAKGAGKPTSQADRFGVLGLLDVIRMSDTDVTTLSLGMDLTSLGLNLNNTDPLYASFVSPFTDTPTLGSEPQFNLPPCYALPTSPPAPLGKISSLSDETLFYVFYSIPRDTLQEATAQELYNRNWRFHKELKLWLTKDASTESVKGVGFERGVFIFFDPTQWSRVKKEWVVYFDQIEERAPTTGAPPTTTNTVPVAISNNNPAPNLGGVGTVVGGNLHINNPDSIVGSLTPNANAGTVGSSVQAQPLLGGVWGVNR